MSYLYRNNFIQKSAIPCHTFTSSYHHLKLEGLAIPAALVTPVMLLLKVKKSSDMGMILKGHYHQ
jgi:hypothetical protein